jgi:Xaa-Pro aminopeptidase
MFDKDIYLRRRRILAKEVGRGIILFPGNHESPMNYAANAYPFRQDSSFLYFFGLDSPGLAATIDVDRGETTIFGDDAGLEDIIWMGPQPRLKDRAAAVGVRKTSPSRELAGIIKAASKKRRTIHFLPPYRADIAEEIRELTGIPVRAVKARASLSLVRAVVGLREIKSREEIAEIETSLEITQAMYLTAMRLAKPGRTETFVIGGMEGVMRSLGGRWAFPPIVTINGHIFHNQDSGNILRRGRMLVADAGSESGLHYACDITRSIPVGGTFTSKQRDVYDIVLSGQKAAIAAIKPGVRYKDVHMRAARTLAKGLKGLGLMKGNTDAAVESGAHALFFPHGLGHMLGLDVHDMEALGETNVGYDGKTERSGQFGLAYLRMARELRPGHVLTVEPGVYFIPALIDDWESKRKFPEFIDYARLRKYRDFGGIRIEDDILVTAGGHRTLGPLIPKEPADIEKAAR